MMLHRVGKYTDQKIGEFSDGLNILYGPNEAGKSTFLAGFRGMLFGKVLLVDETVDTTSGSFGQVWLEDELGRPYHVERSLAKKSPPKITFSDGEVRCGSSVLSDIFTELSEVEEMLFQSVFTFQLADLREVGKNDGLQNRLYGIQGMSQVNPVQIEKKLDEEAKAIFIPRRGAKRALNQCLHDLDEVTIALKKVNDKPDDYNRLRTEVQKQAGDIAQIELEIEKRSTEYANLRFARSILPTIRDWQTMEFKLKSFVHLPHCELSLFTRMDFVKSKLRELSDRRMEVVRRIQDVFFQNERLAVDEKLLSIAPEIFHLQLELSAVFEQARQRDRLSERISGIVREQDVWRSQISDIWTEDRLKNTDLSAARLETLKRIYNTYEEGCSQTTNLHRKLLERQQNEKDARKMLGADDSQVAVSLATLVKNKVQIEERQSILQEEENRLETFSQLMNQYEQIVSNLAANEQQLAVVAQHTRNAQQRRVRRVIQIGWISPLLLIVLSVWLFGISAQKPAVVSLVFGVIVASLLWAFGRGYKTHERKTSSNTSQWMEEIKNEQLRSRLAEVEEQIERVERGFVFIRPGVREIGFIVDMRKSLGVYRNETDAMVQQFTTQERIRERWDVERQQLDRVKIGFLDAQNEQQECFSQWEHELASLLVADMDEVRFVGIANGFFQEASSVVEWRKLERQKEEAMRESSVLVRQIFDFQKAVCRQLDIFIGNKTETLGLDNAAVHIKTAVSRLEETQNRVREKENLTLLAEQFAIQKREIENELSNLHAEATKMFTTVGVDNWDSYEQMVIQVNERREIEQDADSLFRQLVAHCGGSEPKLQEVILFLNGKTDEDLADLLEKCNEKIGYLRQELHREIENQALLNQKLTDLCADRTSQRLNWEKSFLISQRDKLAWDWAAFVIARDIARKARTRYEEENQPRALQLASVMFREITSGQYQFVKSRTDVAGGQVLYCLQGNGSTINVANLSRGTKEQLYMALRLAMVQMFQERGVILPVILDDPMVNFDRERTSRYFRILHRAASNHQFIYLTCHRKIVEMAHSYSNVHVMELDTNELI